MMNEQLQEIWFFSPFSFNLRKTYALLSADSKMSNLSLSVNRVAKRSPQIDGHTKNLFWLINKWLISKG
jgi:hypothetical protein